MKALFLTNQLNVGGIEKNIVRLTRELCARGHVVWTGSNGGSLTQEFLQAGGQHLDLHVTRRPVDLARSVGSIVRFVEHEHPDVVHIFSASSAVLWLLSMLLLRARQHRRHVPPAVSSIMGLQSSPQERRLQTKLRVFLTSLGVRKVIIMAPAIDAFVRSLPSRDERLVHMSVVGVQLPDEVEIAHDRRAVREELGILAEEKAVMTIGNLEPRKSHEFFVQAADVVARRRNDVRFFVVGEGPLRSRLTQQIAGLRSAPVIELLGVRRDIYRLLAACDVYVRPGIVEGFIGITVLEAQAFGVPVVAFETEDVKLAITDRETGVLVPRGDVGALARAIEELLDDEEFARRVGESGRRHVAATFSMSAIADSLLGLYGQLRPDVVVGS